MGLIFDAFWRSVLHCLAPRVVALSLLPLALMGAMSFLLGYFYWSDAVSAVKAGLEATSWLTTLLGWIESLGGGLVGSGGVRDVLAPLIVLGLSMPVVVVVAMLLVGTVMTPAMVEWVAARRFPHLERKRGASFLMSVGWSFWSTAMALVAMLASMPLWLVPPLIMVLPPLIWGWLSYRVFAFDALADHASAQERQALFARHRGPFLALGVLSGFLGALPGLVWASGALFVLMAPLLIPLAIWLYTLVFVFSSLWFVHYGLAALQRLRDESPGASPTMKPDNPKPTSADVQDVEPHPEPPRLPLPPP